MKIIKAIEKGNLKLIIKKVNSGECAQFDFFMSIACRYGKLDIVKFFVEEKGANIKFNDNQSFIYACCNGHLEIAKYLIKKGANIHANEDQSLIYACCNGHLEIVKLLVEHGANINTKDGSALKAAIFSGNTEIVDYLKRKLLKEKLLNAF